MRNVNQRFAGFNTQDAKRKFIEAMRAGRLELSEELIADGHWHRCDAANKAGNSGKNDGCYVLHLDGVPRGSFINYTTDHGNVTNWVFKLDRGLTQDEHRQLENRRKKTRPN